MRILGVVAVLAACGPSDRGPAHPVRQDPARSAAAVSAVRAAQFDVAKREAERVLATEPGDSTAAAVRALARYVQAADKVRTELEAVLDRGDAMKVLDHEAGRSAWTHAAAELAAVDADLAIAAADPQFSLELCLACWEFDWNHNGRVDERDRKLLELEFDGSAGELAEDDPRRKPTYRFDVGDVLWARAMVAFQRGFVELVLAYRWTELDKLFQSGDHAITIQLVDKKRVRKAYDLWVTALVYSSQERQAYLAETDDDREWVPNPRQKSYAMPLAVDDRLYATWDALLGDLQRLLASEQGLSLRELAGALLGDRSATLAPAAYVDVGRMLREPTNIVIDLRDGNGSKEANIERILRGLLGNGYAKAMRASPLVGRLRHMKDELDRSEDTFERKLRYLFWLN